MMVLYVLEDSHLAVVKKKLYNSSQVCGIKVIAIAVLVYQKKKPNPNQYRLPSSTSNSVWMGQVNKHFYISYLGLSDQLLEYLLNDRGDSKKLL